MILDNFKTTSKVDVLFNPHHLYHLQYPGDNQLSVFYNKWIEMLANMKPPDMPSDETLKDCL